MMIEITFLEITDFGPQKARFNARLHVIIPDEGDSTTVGEIHLKNLRLMYNSNSSQCSRVDGMWTAEPEYQKSARYITKKGPNKYVEVSTSIKEDLTALAVEEYERQKQMDISIEC